MDMFSLFSHVPKWSGLDTDFCIIVCDSILYIYKRALLARATRVVVHLIFVLGHPALGIGESYF